MTLTLLPASGDSTQGQSGNLAGLYRLFTLSVTLVTFNAADSNAATKLAYQLGGIKQPSLLEDSKETSRFLFGGGRHPTKNGLNKGVG